jgi:hypothetical protein
VTELEKVGTGEGEGETRYSRGVCRGIERGEELS